MRVNDSKSKTWTIQRNETGLWMDRPLWLLILFHVEPDSVTLWYWWKLFVTNILSPTSQNSISKISPYIWYNPGRADGHSTDKEISHHHLHPKLIFRALFGLILLRFMRTLKGAKKMKPAGFEPGTFIDPILFKLGMIVNVKTYSFKFMNFWMIFITISAFWMSPTRDCSNLFAFNWLWFWLFTGEMSSLPFRGRSGVGVSHIYASGTIPCSILWFSSVK